MAATSAASITVSSGFYSSQPAAVTGFASQLSDAAYRHARATTRTAADEPYTYDDVATALCTPMPTVRVRPIPAGRYRARKAMMKTGSPMAISDESEWEGDGRYTTAEAPDFEQPAR